MSRHEAGVVRPLPFRSVLPSSWEPWTSSRPNISLWQDRHRAGLGGFLAVLAVAGLADEMTGAVTNAAMSKNGSGVSLTQLAMDVRICL